ncbi:hypothetical protein TRFO_12332 [Tritrichomonas foetus]|uniref:Intimal thickness related receptor IRP domain-containing protein n=1 Tax=Tritrichomonas foetus TaxID=1144522 RepID=A0A1J4J6H2_9EUKA|nr:hypothetical protein TRFO_12332 [Tritrichomonas foetus]|eukprot:OHS92772.1 hypothetical protein TRFO_12332 [Tritrichomonas foetus]
MILFLIFTIPAGAEKGYIQITPVNRILFLSSFGFTENSNFHFELSSNLPMKINIFLFSPSELHNVTSKQVHASCFNRYNEIALLNKTSNVSKAQYFWNGTITSQNIYYPTLMICSDTFSSFAIRYKFVNSKYLIDFRDENNSIVYFSFCIVNMILGIIWIFNLIRYHEFSIPLNQFVAILPVIKSVSNALIASEWEQKKVTDDFSIKSHLSFYCSTIFYVLLMSSTTFGFSGWCIYRMDVGIYEKMQVIGSSLFFVTGIMIGTLASDNFTALAPMLLTSVGFLWYMKVNATYLATLVQLVESNIENERMKLRIKLVQKFSGTSFGLICLIMLVQSGAVTLNMWPIAGTIVFESGVVAIEVVEIYFFMLRDQFKGENEAIATNDTPIVLIEPQKQTFVIVSVNKDDESV